MDAKGIQLGEHYVSYYGLMICIGLWLAIILGYRLTRYYKLVTDYYIILVVYAFVGGMIGAKILYLLNIWGYIDFSLLFGNSEYMRLLIGSGFVYWGGVIGGMFAVLLGGRIHGISIWEYVNVNIPCIPLAHGFGRIGCYFAGCCYGIPYSGPGAVEYRSPGSDIDGISLFPVQLAEAGACWLIAAVLLHYILKRRGKHATMIYLVMYSVVRFGLEYLRYDAIRGIYAGLSTSQWISLGCILLCIIIWIVDKRALGR